MRSVRSMVTVIIALVAVLYFSGVSFADALRHVPGAPAAASQQSSPTATLSAAFKQAEVPAGKAAIYIYRPAGAGVGGLAIPFGVRVNDKVLTTLVQGGCYTYFADPGQVEFTVFELGFGAPSSTSSVTVDAKASQAYYLKGSHGKGMGGRAHLESVSPEAGVSEVASCKTITQ